MVLLDHTRSITLYWRWLWHWDNHVKNNIKSIFGGMNPFMPAESFSAVHGGTRVLIYSQMSNGQNMSKTLLVEDEFGGSTKYRLFFFIPEIAIPFLTYEYHGNFPDGPGCCEMGISSSEDGDLR